MKGQPRVVYVDGSTVLRGLVIEGSDEETLLHLAACNQVELISKRREWNTVLLGLTEMVRLTGAEPLGGENLQKLRLSLPVDFR
ncbi:MAG TPA: hypothetical protein HA330_00410 [Candidatus Thalassarchaeaceae archaeon]|nr:MAG TPA: hypothetical protein D7H85_00410 [Candidatus Poseidoniales archaeon]HII48323.1 hypothetical protein [Candidatus Thalassarchaeaceae archaeon]